jgi:hypothetical protein
MQPRYRWINWWGSGASIIVNHCRAACASAQAYYEQGLVNIVRSDPGIAKEVIVWQEVFQTAADPVSTLGTSAVVSVWKGGGAASVLQAVTQAGLHAIVSYCWCVRCVPASLCRYA